MKILVNPFDEAERLATEQGDWVVGVVETQVFWPKQKQIVYYEGKEFVLLPLGQPAPPLDLRQLPAISLRANEYGLTHEQARREIMRFASALAWREGGKIEIVSWTGGNIPRSMGIMRNNAVTDYLSSEYLPSPTDETGRTALAFYREGVSLANPFYAFLSLYKAFSVAVSNSQARGAWITNKRHEIDYPRAKERLAELETQGLDVGNYLYKQGRNAIAHADREPFVNPDKTDDHFRLSLDLPLMRNFTELAIEERFGITRKVTIYREHLYELEGLRNLLPKEVVECFKRGEGSDASFEIDLPEHFLLLAQKGHEQFPLEEMKIAQAGCFEYGLVIDFESAHATVRLRVFANFVDEKLLFDPLRYFRIIPNRDRQEAIQEELSAVQFHRCILSNGHLEIWDPISNNRLGCSEGYIPMNCFVNDEYFDQQTRDLEALLKHSAS